VALTAPIKSELGPEVSAALLLEADAQRARQQYGVFAQGLGIGVRNCFYVAEIFFEPRAVQACLIQVLRRSYKNTWPAAHGGA
jgi:hypothetical protein